MKRIKKLFGLIATVCLAISASCLLFSACNDNGDGGDGEQNEEKELTAISLDTTNATLVFDAGDEFSCTGLLVNATYSDDSVVPMFASDCTVSAPDITQKGTKSVTVTYGNKIAEYEITVRELLSISVDAGTKTSFASSDDFDYSGITVTAHYDDGIADSVVSAGQYTVSSPDMSTCGQKTVTVTYKGKTADYTINVANAPVIHSAELKEKDGGVGLVISGVVTGYTEEQFGLDLQKLGSADTVAVNPEVTLGDEGAFEIYCNINSLSLNYGDDYMIHLFIDGTSYDVVDIQTPADGTVKQGEIIYEIKSEQWFSNNTSYFVVLRCGNEDDIIEKTVTVKSATITEEQGKVYYVVSGEYTGSYSQSDFELDVEDTVNWSGKTQLTTTATLDNGALTVRADITSLGAGRYLTHLIVDGKSNDIKNITVTEAQFDTGVKHFAFNSQIIFDNGLNDYYATITVTSNFEPSYTVTGATLEEEDNKVLFVLSGTCNASTQEELNTFGVYFDFESNPYAMTGGSAGDWVRYCKGNLTLVLDGAGSFKATVDVTDLAPYTYTAHLGAASSNFEFDGTNTSLTVNGKTYALTFGESGFWGATGLTITNA